MRAGTLRGDEQRFGPPLTLQHGGPRALRVLKRAIEDKQAGVPPAKLAAEELREVLNLAHCYHMPPLMDQAIDSLAQLPLAQTHAWLQEFLAGGTTPPYDLIESVVHALPEIWKFDCALSLSGRHITPQSEDAVRALSHSGWLRAGEAPLAPSLTDWALGRLRELPPAQSDPWLQGFLAGDTDAPHDLKESVMQALPLTRKVDFALSLSGQPTAPRHEDTLRALSHNGWLKAGDVLLSDHAWHGMPKDDPLGGTYRAWRRHASAQSTVLCLAVAQKCVPWVESLLDAPGGETAVNTGWMMDVNDFLLWQHGEGQPLHLALRAQGAAMTRLLLERGAQTVPESFFFRDPSGYVYSATPSCLTMAVYSGDPEKVDLIVRYEPKPWSEAGHRKSANLTLRQGQPDLARRIPIQLTLKERIFGAEVPTPEDFLLAVVPMEGGVASGFPGAPLLGWLFDETWGIGTWLGTRPAFVLGRRSAAPPPAPPRPMRHPKSGT